MSLRDKAEQMNQSKEGIPFMDGRAKGEIPVDEIVSVVGFGFINGTDGEYVVLDIAEFPEEFFFGGKVVTEKFKELDEQMTVGDRKELESDGMPVRFQWKVGKDHTDNRGKKVKGRKYMVVEFYPEDDIPFNE